LLYDLVDVVLELLLYLLGVLTRILLGILLGVLACVLPGEDVAELGGHGGLGLGAESDEPPAEYLLNTAVGILDYYVGQVVVGAV
jgi:hypothetical protein